MYEEERRNHVHFTWEDGDCQSPPIRRRRACLTRKIVGPLTVKERENSGPKWPSPKKAHTCPLTGTGPWFSIKTIRPPPSTRAISFPSPSLTCHLPLPVSPLKMWLIHVCICKSRFINLYEEITVKMST